MGEKSAAKAKAQKTKAPAEDTKAPPKEPEAAAPTVTTPPARGPRHLRAPIEIRVEITARSQSFTTTSRNIALGGISFESQQQFRVGDLVNVLLYIPVKKELELLKVASEVVWVEDLGGSWMCGTAFRKFAPGDERRLREWLLESVRAQKAGFAGGIVAHPEPDDDDE
jgi:Tfp pilus assembly protein PilZ